MTIRHFICIFLGICSFISAFTVEGEAERIGIHRLEEIHSKLRLIYGSFCEEYPEQVMTAMYLPSNAKVLELGANIGRNSCVIASILEDSRNLVSVEPCLESAQRLMMNKQYNQLHFRIEVAAVSKHPLVQRDWVSVPSEVDLPGHFRIRTIPFAALQKKHQIVFDTLVADCEGALYYMLKDDPEILNNIRLILIENDFRAPEHKTYVAELFAANGFQLIYNKDNFYQVWKK